MTDEEERRYFEAAERARAMLEPPSEPSEADIAREQRAYRWFAIGAVVLALTIVGSLTSTLISISRMLL